MAVPEQTPYKEFTANGITKVFPLEFDVLEQDHLIVLVNDLEPTVGSWSLDAQNDTVVFALPPANGANIKIRRDTPLSRSTDYESYNNSFRPKPVNDDMDNIWRKLQEMGVINWMIDNNIKDLNEYVDGLNDETKAIFLQMIQEQGTSLEQLDAYVDQLYKNLANVAADNGWFSEFVADGDENQKQINNLTIRNFESLEDLLGYTARYNGQTVYLKSIHYGLKKGGDNFVYNESKKLINDGGNCFYGWVRQTPESYFNVHNFGGIGDGSVNDYDHGAFVKISKACISSNLDALVIHIPDGDYLVGSQKFEAGKGYSYQDILSVYFPAMTEKSIILKSDGAKLKIKSGLHFGVFHKTTGAPFATTMPWYPGTPSYDGGEGQIASRVDIGYMLNFENIKTFMFSGKIELDGNREGAIVGGQYGDTGWQVGAYGFRIRNVKQFDVSNIYTHDHCLDGMYIAGYNPNFNPDLLNPDYQGSVRNVISTRNSRQACSLCGGQNISFYDCTFSDTATIDMKVRSAPMSGFDIEAEVSPIRNIKIYNCIFSNNAITQMVADSHDTKDVQFYSCRFLNSTTGSTVWVRKPKFKFYNCYINGYVEGQYATEIEEDRTLYQGCTFTDDPKENINVRASEYLINAAFANPKLVDCKINIFKSGLIYDYNYAGSIDKFTMKDSEINIFTESPNAAMNGIYDNVVINDLRADPTVTIYPTFDGGRYNNVVVKSPTGSSGIILYGGTNIQNTRKAVTARSCNPYDVLEITPFDLKGFHTSGNQGVSSLVKVAYSPMLNLMNIQYNTGDIIHCTMPGSGIDKWICVTGGMGTASVWKKVPLTLQDI